MRLLVIASIFVSSCKELPKLAACGVNVGSIRGKRHSYIRRICGTVSLEKGYKKQR